MRNYVIVAWMAFILLLSAGGAVAADQEAAPETPLWEFGMFNAAAVLPHYRGSDEYQWYVVPLPYLIYRGKILQTDRDGVRGIFFRNDFLETNISLYGNPPVSGDNDAREGMPDLDALVEFGPALEYYPMGRRRPDLTYLKFALRGVASIDFSGFDMQYEGLHGCFNVIHKNRTLLQDWGLELGATLGVDVTDGGYNSYLYDVPGAYARPDRPAYESDGGYAGFYLSSSLYKRLTKNLSAGCYVRWENIDGAAFEDSPLARRTNNVVVGCALVWKILTSKKPAEADVD